MDADETSSGERPGVLRVCAVQPALLAALGRFPMCWQRILWHSLGTAESALRRVSEALGLSSAQDM